MDGASLVEVTVADLEGLDRLVTDLKAEWFRCLDFIHEGEGEED